MLKDKPHLVTFSESFLVSFANLRSSHTRDLKKMALDASLINTQHYKVWIKGKMEQSKETGSTLLYTSV